MTHATTQRLHDALSAGTLRPGALPDLIGDLFTETDTLLIADAFDNACQYQPGYYPIIPPADVRHDLRRGIAAAMAVVAQIEKSELTPELV